MITGCYSLDLYCRNHPMYSTTHLPGKGPHGYGTDNEGGIGGFTDRTKRGCIAQAKKAGWRFVDGDVFCADCAKARVRS